MQQATTIKPDAAVLWLELGIAQTGQKKYDDAATSLKKAMDLDTASKKPNPEIQAADDNALGEVYANTNKIPDATASYDAAAKLQPANAGMFYTNETIVLSRAGQTDATIAAADKAIAADPTKADSLLPEGTGAHFESHRGSEDAEDRRASGYRGSLQQVPRIGPQRADGARSEVDPGGDRGEGQHQVLRRQEALIWLGGRNQVEGTLLLGVPLLLSGGTSLEHSAPSRVVSYADASRIVREQADRLAPRHAPEFVGLLDTLGRVLAEPILADRDQPPFPRSTRDGFACRAADVAAGLPLEVIGSIRAGDAVVIEVSAGKAVEIMTGAPVPAGADCVVMVEHVQRDRDKLRLSPGRSVQPGENIVPMGAEARAGAVIVPEGTRISPAQIAVAAACGAGQLSVYGRPRVAIVATGDELVEVNQQPQSQQIRNSNSYSLAAQILAAGAEPVRLPIARDERGHLEGIIRCGLETDLVLLSGGVSMGKYDLVEEVLLSLGAEFFFTGALIQPGKPVVFGRLGEHYFFGLPGNPVSTMVTFLLFVEPVLGALCGDVGRAPRFTQARLTSEVQVKTGLTRFLPARLADGNVEPVTWQGSGDLASTSHSNCFLVVPPDQPVLAAGETVTILL